jgi:hypothetical protein
MKNRVLKTCLTALALSVAGLATAEPIDLLTYSVISGGAVNIAAQPDYVTAPNVGGHLAGQAAVTIGAFTTVNDIYAGAAVTTGASSRVKQIYAGAAAGVGANAYAQDVDAGAAVVVGAGGAVGDISAGAAITLGAGSTYYSTPIDAVVTEGAGSMVVSPENGGYTDDGVIVIAADLNAAMEAINAKFVDNPVDVNEVETYTDLSGLTIGVEGGETTVNYSTINLQANTTLSIVGNVTVITSGAMTIGAGANIELVGDATVTWILGGSLNLGAGSKFSGETYVNGAVSGATSDIACGNLYAIGAVSVATIGGACLNPAVGLSLRAHEGRINTLQGQTSQLGSDLANIVLPTGPAGTKGSDGADGTPGAKGDTGVAGANGTPGAKGDRGNAGSNGQNGIDGIGAIAGTDVGQMQYWDGDTWEVIDAPTADSQVLTFVNGAFSWNDPTF